MNELKFATPLGVLLLAIAVFFGFSNVDNDGVPNIGASISYGFAHYDWPLMIGTVLLGFWVLLFLLGFVLYFARKGRA